MFGNDKSRKNGLNIIVVGGGKVGATLVERLSRENHDVTLIDKNRVKLDAITGAYDVMGVGAMVQALLFRKKPVLTQLTFLYR